MVESQILYAQNNNRNTEQCQLAFEPSSRCALLGLSLSPGRTTDRDIQSLLRELSIFGYAQPMSNDSMLETRRKINSLCIYTGLQDIWFTINPNDVNNPVKHRVKGNDGVTCQGPCGVVET